MRRRALLKRGGAGIGTLALLGTGTTGTAVAETGSYAPIGSVEVPGTAEGVVGQDGETAYLATGDGFATVDLSDPGNPEVLARVTGIASGEEEGPLTNVMDVKAESYRLLVVGPANYGSLNGLAVYDVSDPANPTMDTDFYRTGFAIHNADFDGQYAYLTNNAAPNRPMTVVDVSGRTPTELARWSPLDVSLPGVEGWDDATAIPGVLHDLHVHDGVAYCVYWDAGTWMVDVSDPRNPTYLDHVGDYDLETLLSASGGEYERMYREAPGNDHYVTVSEDASLMAIGGEGWDLPATDGGGPAGIDLWDVSNPGSPERRSTIYPETAPDLTRSGTWTTAHNFDLSAGRLYSAWYDAGVKVHDVSDPSDPELLAWWRSPDEARFWTAEMGVLGQFFVATSYGTDDRRSGLYVFPDRAGTQADPPVPFTESEKWYPDAPIPSAYFDENGVVTTERLQAAVRDWIDGSISTDVLNGVVRFWTTGRNVMDSR